MFLINNNLIKNNLINIFNFLIIPIYFILIFLLEKNKNKKIINKINLENKKIEDEINLINKQTQLLNDEIEKEEKEINDEQNKIDNKIEIEISKIKNDFKNKIDINNYLDKMQSENLAEYIYQKQEELNKNKLELQTIKIKDEDIFNKLEKMVNVKEEYEALKEELKDLEEKNDLINLTKELLEKAYIEMRNNITPKFTENLSNNISKISNKKYTKVSLNDEKGLIVENEFGEYILAERLSSGTIDQLYLSLRLSMIDDLSKEKMPIILDEAFAYYDDVRLENILDFLNNNMNEHQVLIFTCTNREKEILDKLSIEYNLIEL